MTARLPRRRPTAVAIASSIPQYTVFIVLIHHVDPPCDAVLTNFNLKTNECTALQAQQLWDCDCRGREVLGGTPPSTRPQGRGTQRPLVHQCPPKPGRQGPAELVGYGAFPPLPRQPRGAVVVVVAGTVASAAREGVGSAGGVAHPHR